MKLFKNINFILIFIILISFLVRIPFLFLPFDGAYEYWLAFLGRQSLVGSGFYSIPWSLKPPGESLVYGLVYLLTGALNWELGIRLLSAVLNCGTAVVFFLFGRSLTKNRAGGFTAAFLWITYSTMGPFYASHAYAEMLMPFFTLSGAYLFISNTKKQKHLLFLAGLFMGISLLFKQSAVYDFLPLIIYAVIIENSENRKLLLDRIKTNLKINFLFIAGFLLPLLIFIGYILFIGRISSFIEWTVIKPVFYGKIRGSPWSYSLYIWKNSLIIWVAVIIAFIIYMRNKKISWLFMWIFGVFLSLYSSGKYWDYYFIQGLLPGILLASLSWSYLYNLGKKTWPFFLFYLKLFLIIFLLVYNFYNILKNYRPHFKLFYHYLSGRISLSDFKLHQSLSLDNWERVATADYLNKNRRKSDRIYIFDTCFSLYILTDTLPLYNDFVQSQQFWYPKEIGVGFTFFPFSQNPALNRKNLIAKLKRKPPDWIVIGFDSPDERKTIWTFPDFYAFILKNYINVKRQNSIWIFKLNKNKSDSDNKLFKDVYKEYFKNPPPKFTE